MCIRDRFWGDGVTCSAGPCPGDGSTGPGDNLGPGPVEVGPSVAPACEEEARPADGRGSAVCVGPGADAVGTRSIGAVYAAPGIAFAAARCCGAAGAAWLVEANPAALGGEVGCVAGIFPGAVRVSAVGLADAVVGIVLVGLTGAPLEVPAASEGDSIDEPVEALAAASGAASVARGSGTPPLGSVFVVLRFSSVSYTHLTLPTILLV